MMLNIRTALCIAIVCSTLAGQAQSNRTLDGYGNHTLNPVYGAAGDVMKRNTPNGYLDNLGIADLSGPNPRVVSNVLFAQEESLSNDKNLSDFAWAFAQFISHEIKGLEQGQEQLTNIIAPENDTFFSDGEVVTSKRYDFTLDENDQRQYRNIVTAFIDGSSIYGVDVNRASWLRTFENGKLKTSEGNNLPWNTINGEFNGTIDQSAPAMLDETRSLPKYFVAGDIRANENPLLLAFHTLFVREHNRLCDEILQQHPDWSDERIYQRARKMVGALLQSITYNEWLPTLGLKVPAYTGYKPQTRPTIDLEFEAAAFELSHTLSNKELVRMDYDGSEINTGNIALADAWYNPLAIEIAGGIDPYIKGMASQIQQDLDCKIIDAVRNFDYRGLHAAKSDKAALTINKAKDLGVLSYNQLRLYFGLPRYSTFGNITSNTEAASSLAALYDNVESVDAWVGMLAEDHLPGSTFGQLTSRIIERQFQSLRDGDRYYYTIDRQLDEATIEEISNTSLHDIIARNTAIDLMQDNVFVAMPHSSIPDGPDLIPIALEAEIFPNPVGDYVQVKTYLDIDKPISVRVIDLMGHTLFDEVFEGQAGYNVIRFPLGQECPRGYYNLVLETNRKMKTLRFVKR